MRFIFEVQHFFGVSLKVITLQLQIIIKTAKLFFSSRRTLIPGRETSELGEDGYLLMQTILPTEHQQHSELAENSGPKKLKLTQSCQLPTKYTSIIPKVIARRKSV